MSAYEPTWGGIRKYRLTKKKKKKTKGKRKKKKTGYWEESGSELRQW